MFDQLLTPPYIPFVFSFFIMVGIGLIETIGLGLGHLDLDADGTPDAENSVLAWLGLGDELPVLIWLTSLLGCFTLTGAAVQQMMTAFSGAPLPPGIAAGTALVVGTVLNSFAANGLARIMPGFETSVISTDDLLRLRGTVLEGAARRGSPARAKVVDHHGQAHFVMLEPHEESDIILAGETALLVRRDGKLFFAVPDQPTSLNPI
jgi:hypothetical protein